jgi:hypothetical protein
MTPEEWFKALDTIGKIYMSPRAKWNSRQIFFRTVWMPAKNRQASRDANTAECLNCFHHTADTLHIFVHCPVARRIWKKIEKIMKLLKKWMVNYTYLHRKSYFIEP